MWILNCSIVKASKGRDTLVYFKTKANYKTMLGHTDVNRYRHMCLYIYLSICPSVHPHIQVDAHMDIYIYIYVGISTYTNPYR